MKSTRRLLKGLFTSEIGCDTGADTEGVVEVLVQNYASKIWDFGYGPYHMDRIIWYLAQRPPYYDGPIIPDLGYGSYHMSHMGDCEIFYLCFKDTPTICENRLKSKVSVYGG